MNYIITLYVIHTKYMRTHVYIQSSHNLHNTFLFIRKDDTSLVGIALLQLATC